jgi:hypothetical protein
MGLRHTLEIQGTNYYHYGYVWRICQDGTSQLRVYPSVPNIGYTVIWNGKIANLNLGHNKSNTLAGLLNGHTINLYVNHKLLTTVTDSSYAKIAGSLVLGLFEINAQTDVAFTDARVWTL